MQKRDEDSQTYRPVALPPEKAILFLLLLWFFEFQTSDFESALNSNLVKLLHQGTKYLNSTVLQLLFHHLTIVLVSKYMIAHLTFFVNKLR